jgi:protein-S-isoprenylcysteine O-methyltransferase Ste14
MMQHNNPHLKTINRLTARSALVLSLIVVLEILIMISPFALFFYAVFNPFLLTLNQSPVTQWLTAFFLPHMIVPPSEALVVIRIVGSVLFAGGLFVFLVCAAQVYLGKLFRKGIASMGLYSIVRHPQYIGLAATALGLAFIWPRFLTLALFAVMLFLYYLLARDEESRMSDRFGESYVAYMNRTGMFLPRIVEKLFIKKPDPQHRLSIWRTGRMFLMLTVVIVGSGFVLRAYTVHCLPLQRIGTVDVITITAEDSSTANELVPRVLEDSLVLAKIKPFLEATDHRVLAYFIPIDYVMQGLIANTGDEWKLFEHHKTISMITDNILHPFTHITGGHAHHMMEGVKHGPEMYALPMMKRRVIFIDVSSDGQDLNSPMDDFNINVKRTPLIFVDVHLHTAEILQVRETPTGSGWGTVPTPMF